MNMEANPAVFSMFLSQAGLFVNVGGTYAGTCPRTVYWSFPVNVRENPCRPQQRDTVRGALCEGRAVRSVAVTPFLLLKHSRFQ